MKLELQQNLQVYFFNGWVATLDKLQVKASSSLRLKSNIPIPKELIIVPNPEIQDIINNESRVWEVERASPTAVLRGEATNSAAVSSTE